MLEKLKNIVLHAGLTKEEYMETREARRESNRKHLAVYSSFGAVVFMGLVIFSLVTDGAIQNNFKVYAVAFCIFAFLFFLNAYVFKKHPSRINTIFVYSFIVSLLAIGMYLGLVIGPNERTAAYIALITLTPVLFFIRPIGLILVMLIANGTYLYLIQQIQTGENLGVNRLNVVCFGFVGTLVGMHVICVKARRIIAEVRYLKMLDTDQLTDLPNRRCYEGDLENLRTGKTSYERLVVMAFDVNGLKKVNDTKGHKAGEQLIIASANCIQNAFGKYGRCYRTGGDEFMVLLTRFEGSLKNVVADFEASMQAYHNDLIGELSISYGYVCSEAFPRLSVDEYVNIADANMYAYKANYYKDKHVDRRRQV